MPKHIHLKSPQALTHHGFDSLSSGERPCSPRRTTQTFPSKELLPSANEAFITATAVNPVSLGT